MIETRDGTAFPDTLVGTDSHTTMVNGLGVLGWGVGGIEAEAGMLGEALSMLVPQVVGFRLTGELPEGATATDLVLTVTEILRRTGVVGKFVEYFGPGLGSLSVADRATIGNMSPEYGATCGFFPVDGATLDYLRLTGRPDERVALVEAYCKENMLWHEADDHPTYSQVVELDLGTVEPEPRRAAPAPGPRPARATRSAPSSRRCRRFGVDYGNARDEAVAESFPASDPPAHVEPGHEDEPSAAAVQVALAESEPTRARVRLGDVEFELQHGSVVIAAITSCTNTSNPQVMVAAGLLAKKAVERGLERKPWVKSSLAPGSRVVTDYYEKAGLTPYLEALGFHTVGYGCTTCIGNSGPLPEEISAAIVEQDLAVCAVLSGNRNFEARIHPEVKANYLASPPLVVAYALAGRDGPRPDHRAARAGPRRQRRLPSRPLADVAGDRRGGRRRRLRRALPRPLRRRVHRRRALARAGESLREPLRVAGRLDVRPPSALLRRDVDASRAAIEDVHGARCLVVLGDSVTTDHISPAGSIKPDSPAGPLPRRPRRRAARVQLVRLAAREPRGDGARHLRERPAAQPARPRQRGHLDGAPARAATRCRSSRRPSATWPRERR